MRSKIFVLGAVLVMCLTALACVCTVTDESDATNYTYSATDTGLIDLYPAVGDVITITNVSSINDCPYGTLNTSTHVATITIPQMAAGKYSVYDSYVINDTSGGHCWMNLHSNQNWPTGRLTDYFYERSDPIYVANGTQVSFTATYDDTDDMTYYLDYEKVTYVTPGVGLTLNSRGDLNGTVNAPAGSTIYIDWADHYDFNDEGITDISGRLTLVVVSFEHPHTVHYDGNGNTGGSTVDTVVTAQGTGNVSVTLATNGFVKTGHSFAGWLVNGTVYQPGQTVSVGADQTVTAVAQWTANSVTATANNLSAVSGMSYSNQIGASCNNDGTISYAVTSCTGGTATVNGSGLVTYSAPVVSSTANYTVTVTVTASYPDGSSVSQVVSFTVTVDPVLSFTNAATSGTLSVKGA